MESDSNRVSKVRTSGRSWAGIIGLVLLFLALRWNSYDAPLIRDEGEYAYAAQLLRHGLAPYQNSFLQKPPMVIYTYLLANLVAPGLYWFPRILAYLFAGLATCLLGYIGQKEFGRSVSFSAMWLMTPMILLPGITQFTANTEMFMLLPVMGTLAVYVRARHSGGGPGYWLTGGVLGAVAICYKYTSFPLCVLLFVAASLDEWRRKRSVSHLAKCWFFALLGVTAATLAALVFFLIHDGGRSLWECTIEYNQSYAAATFGWRNLGHRLQELWIAWWFLFPSLGLILVGRWPRTFFWTLIFLAAWMTTAGSPYRQYYVTVMPFWALLVAIGIHNLDCRLRRTRLTLPSWFGSALTAVLVIGACLPDVPSLLASKKDFAAAKMKTWSPFLESKLVAGHVKRLTSPKDCVFIAGSEPQILYYADRFSCSRFAIIYPLMIPTTVAERYQSEAIHDLESRPPAVVAIVRLATSWLSQRTTPPGFLDYLNKVLNERYDLVGGYLIGDKTSGWQEPLAKVDVERCSLVVFKRKP